MKKAAVAAAILACLAFTPAPFLFACACTCGTDLPVHMPEAPWVPVLLVAGIGAALLVLRRRGGGRGSSPPSGGAGGDLGGARRPGLRRRIGLAMAALLATSVVVGATSTAITSLMPAAAATTICDCNPASGVLGIGDGLGDGLGNGAYSGVAGIDAPNVGIVPDLVPGIVVMAGGSTLICVALAIRRRRKVLSEREVDGKTQL